MASFGALLMAMAWKSDAQGTLRFFLNPTESFASGFLYYVYIPGGIFVRGARLAFHRCDRDASFFFCDHEPRKTQNWIHSGAPCASIKIGFHSHLVGESWLGGMLTLMTIVSSFFFF
jgi:hypothetical protein